MIMESREDYIRYLPKGLPIYFQPEFLNAVDENWTALVKKIDNNVLYMLPCKKRRKYGLRLYGPVELAHDNAVVFLDKKASILSLEGSLNGLFRVLINDRNNVLKKKNTESYNKTLRNRQMINLKAYPRHLDDIRKKTRQNIKKATSYKLLIDDRVDRFYNLYSSTFDRRKVDKWAKDRYEKVYRGLKEHFDTRIYVLEDEKGRALAANWVIGYQNTLYGILRAKNYEIKQRGTQEFTMWNVIQEMREEYDYWDLGGSNIPGVKRFNLEMGAENISYPVYGFYKPRIIGKLVKLMFPGSKI